VTRRKLVVVLVVAVLVGAFFALGLHRYLTLDYLRASRDSIAAYVGAHPVASGAAFFLVYVATCAVSLPGAAVLTLAAGALFGFGWGTLLASFASSIGATLAFLIARTVLRDWVRAKVGARLDVIDRGIARDGNFYLFTLRMTPVFPFFLVNLAMALTAIGVAPFYVVSQIGMLAGTMVYVFAGTQLARVHSLSDVLSPGLIAALTLLGVFPLIAKQLIAVASRRRSARHE
jgi:uncharacterized membrane protein YdjX (TVP38/TMEM64 family)